MKILVTGASGFVGQWVLADLSKKAEVIAVVRNKKKLNQPYEKCIIPSIDGMTHWEGKLTDVDVVVHLAARVHVMRETSADPLSDFRAINTEGTRILAKEAQKQGVQRFVFISSIAVNGKGTDGAAYSSSDTASPVDPYGISKWEAEEAIREISRTTGLEVIIIRPPVIYGPAAKGNIQRLLKLVKTKLPLPFGLVDNRRSMISIQNFSTWIDRAVFEETPPDGPVLAADPRPISTKELITGIGEGLGRKPYLLPVPVGVMKYCSARMGKANMAQQLLGDFEILPTYEAFPGIKAQLMDPTVEIPKISRHAGWREHN